MFSSHFRHDTIRKYTACFGSLFNELSIERKNKTNAKTKMIKVPLDYGPGQKHIIKNNERDSTDDTKKVKVTYPRMSFSLVDFAYDPLRQPNKSQTLSSNGNTQYNRVPYNFYYQVIVKTKNIDDGNQIVEQICPFFTPYINISMVDNSDLNVASDITVHLEGVTPEDTYEGSLEDSRELEWRFNFTLKGWMYKPSEIKQVIKQVNLTVDDFTKDLVDIDAAVNPPTANEEDPHTVDLTITIN